MVLLRSKFHVLILILAGLLLALVLGVTALRRQAERSTSASQTNSAYAGSSECRECHESFYQKWAPSHHGLAMQPCTKAFARANLTNANTTITVGQRRYWAETGGDTRLVWEEGPEGRKSYPMAHALGGKNVYYFLTPVERGRLQVLPIAYDVRRREWYDTTASAVRHFQEQPDTALHWREQPLTFNTSCHACHVSQITANYDLAKDAYQTTWREPGISCETCHGPGEEHVKVCRAATKGKAPKDLKIVQTKKFTHDQNNALCAPCHAKMTPLTLGGTPGDRYCEHYDLVAFEDRDFYPDGRDLGENYTYTQWLTSPCVKSGQLDCLHCHTSSGRYRFAEAEANSACLPCHKDKVEHPTNHTHHAESSGVNRCVACHMPKTEFARMGRTDHSMKPPTPAATLAFQSPNACNLCHTNQTAAWADGFVRKWHANDYQAPVLRHAGWIDDARKNRWAKLPEMLAYLAQTNRDEILAVSLARLLANCPSNMVDAALVRALKDPSPLLRASAASVLGTRLTPEFVAPLLGVVGDEYRLVRIRAAAALAGMPIEGIPVTARPALERATAEFESSMRARPDDSASHYNLGNLYFSRQDAKRAADEFDTAIRLHPENLPAMVNASLAQNQLGNNDRAEQLLKRALALDPTNSAANLNLGLLLGELGRQSEAIACLRRAWNADTNSATAAHNLGILLAKERPAEALEYFRQTVRLEPQNPKYIYTLAFYQQQNSQVSQAVSLLQKAVNRQVADAGIYSLLGAILEQEGQISEARACYRQAADNEQLPPDARQEFRQRSQMPTLSR